MSKDGSDRELLELAAKAAGYWVRESLRNGEFRVCEPGKMNLSFAWNPRDDDGDSRRLEVALEIALIFDDDRVNAYKFGPKSIEVFELFNGDKAAATRRAVFRVAVEVGRAME